MCCFVLDAVVSEAIGSEVVCIYIYVSCERDACVCVREREEREGISVAGLSQSSLLLIAVDMRGV